MFKVVKLSQASIRQIAENKIAINYITKDISPDISLATTEATDYDEKETTIYNRVYYVLEGALMVTVAGQSVSLETGDACYIEKGTTYEMKGTFKAVIVNQPAFGSSAD